MNVTSKINAVKIRKIQNKNWLSFPFFLLISIILYSFVVIKDKSPDMNFVPEGKDSIVSNQPKIDIKVNRKYDEKGNLIQFDSSYSEVYTSPDANVQFFNFDHDSLFSQFKHKIEMNSFFNDDFFNGSQPFGLNQDFFQMDPMMNFKQMEEMINKMKMFQHSDSNFIYPQQNNQPPKNNSTPNMITL